MPGTQPDETLSSNYLKSAMNIHTDQKDELQSSIFPSLTELN